MQRVFSIFMAGTLAAFFAPVSARGTDSNTVPPPITCGNGVPGGVNCIVSKSELKEAHNAYSRGLKLQEHHRVEEAFAQFDQAAKLVPQDAQFLTARELAKAQLVFEHVQRGNALLLENERARAQAEFRAALDLDPENQFASERLADAEGDPSPPAGGVPWLADTGEIHLQPKKDPATFHYRGEVRGMFNELASTYGVSAQFDDSVATRQVRFNVEDVDFFTALKLACQVSKTMWTALDAHQFLLAADTAENHKQFDRMSLRTFILPPHSAPAEVTELVTTMRNMFDLHFVSTGQTGNTIEVRGPQPALEACAKLMAQLARDRPQVMFDVRIYQISHDLTRNIGVHIPNTFTMTNIPAAALAGLGGQSIQDLINQLISSGGINQAGSSALSGLLAQLGGQGNSIFNTPQATFGGGLTFMGLSLDQFSAALSLNESWVRSLEHMNMRAGQGNDATFHLGTRYPILNASYAPVFNSPQISQVLGNQSYVPPFPSVSYEDLGLNVKITPTVHGNGEVSLKLELEVRSLTGQSNNGVPVISNREYKGSINLKDGEPAVVAGQVSRTDQRSMTGIPGLGFLPVLNQAMVNNTKEVDEDELMIVITPYVLSNFERATDEIWISEK